MVHSALVTDFALTSDYSSRGGVAVDSIGHHHAAGTSAAVAIALFQPGGRTVSPNYLIDRKRIYLIVPEEYRAWTSADAWADGRSITYEIINSTGSPDWSFDPETLDTIARLDADISRRYGIVPRHSIPGFWEHRNLYEWYGRSYATACAGPSFDINAIIGSALSGLADTVVPIGDNLMTLSRTVVDPRNGALYFHDINTGVDRVSTFVSSDMDNATVVDSLNDAFGKYHTPDSGWAFDVLTALVSRRAAAAQKRLVDAVVKATTPPPVTPPTS